MMNNTFVPVNEISELECSYNNSELECSIVSESENSHAKTLFVNKASVSDEVCPTSCTLKNETLKESGVPTSTEEDTCGFNIGSQKTLPCDIELCKDVVRSGMPLSQLFRSDGLSSDTSLLTPTTDVASADTCSLINSEELLRGMVPLEGPALLREYASSITADNPPPSEFVIIPVKPLKFTSSPLPADCSAVGVSYTSAFHRNYCLVKTDQGYFAIHRKKPVILSFSEHLPGCVVTALSLLAPNLSGLSYVRRDGLTLGQISLHNMLVKSYHVNRSTVLADMYQDYFNSTIPDYLILISVSQGQKLTTFLETVKGNTAKVRDFFSNWMHNKVAKIAGAYLNDSIGKYLNGAIDLILGFLDPFNLWQSLYEALIKKYASASEEDRKWFESLWVKNLCRLLGGSLSMLLISLGLSLAHRLWLKYNIDVKAESPALDLAYNLATEYMPEIFPTDEPNKVLMVITECWDWFKSKLAYAPGVSVVAITFIATFLPKAISSVFFRVFGTDQQKAGWYYENIRSKYNKLVIHSQQPGCASDPVFKQLVDDCIKACEKVPTQLRYTTNSFVTPILNQCYKYRGAIINVEVADSQRPIPMWMHIYGATGVGKSTMVDKLKKIALERFTYRGLTLNQCIERPNNVTYNNGYRGQEMEIWEEFLNVEDPATRSFILAEALPKLCCSPYLPQIASVDATNPAGCKGTPYEGRFVLSINNQVDFGPISYNIGSALARRRNLTVHVLRDDTKYDSDNNIKKEFIKDLGDPVALNMRFEIIKPVLFDTQISYVVTKVVDWEGLVDEMMDTWNYVQTLNSVKGLIPLRETRAKKINAQSEKVPSTFEINSDDQVDDDLSVNQPQDVPIPGVPLPLPEVLLPQPNEEEVVGAPIPPSELEEERLVPVDEEEVAPHQSDEVKQLIPEYPCYPYLCLYPKKAYISNFRADPITGVIWGGKWISVPTNMDITVAGVETDKCTCPVTLKLRNGQEVKKYLNRELYAAYRFVARAWVYSGDKDDLPVPETFFIKPTTRILQFHDTRRYLDSTFRINYNALTKTAWYARDYHECAEDLELLFPDLNLLGQVVTWFMSKSKKCTATQFDAPMYQRFVYELYSLYQLCSFAGDGLSESLLKVVKEIRKCNPTSYVLSEWDRHFANEDDQVIEVSLHGPQLHATFVDKIPPPAEHGPVRVVDQPVYFHEDPEPQPSIVAEARKKKQYAYVVLYRQGEWVIVPGSSMKKGDEVGFGVVSNSPSVTLKTPGVESYIQTLEKNLKHLDEVNSILEIDLTAEASPVKAPPGVEKTRSMMGMIGTGLRVLLEIYRIVRTFQNIPMEPEMEAMITAEARRGAISGSQSADTQPSTTSSQGPRRVHRENFEAFNSVTLTSLNNVKAEATTEPCLSIIRLGTVPFNAIYIGSKIWITHRHNFADGLNKVESATFCLMGHETPVLRSKIDMQAVGLHDMVALKVDHNFPALPSPASFMTTNQLFEWLASKADNASYVSLCTTVRKTLTNVHYAHNQSYWVNGEPKSIIHALGYNGTNTTGDCGAPVVAYVPQPRVVGMHLAGGKQADAKVGFALLLSKDLIRNVVDLFDHPVAESLELALPPGFKNFPKVESALVRTPYADIFGNTDVPAILSKEDPSNIEGVDPYAYTIRELTSYQAPPVNQDAFNRAVADMSTNVATAWKEVPDSVKQKWELTLDAAVAGHGDTDLEPVNHRVSGGYPDITMFAGPKDRFEMKDGLPKRLTERYEEQVLRFGDQLEKGAKPTCYYIANVKDEVQKASKRAEGRSRIVYEMCQSHLVYIKWKFGRTLQFFNKLYGHEFCHSLNAASHDFHYHVWGYLSEIGATKFIAGDYKAYDMHIHPKFQRAAYEILFSIVNESPQLKENLIEYLMHPVVLFPDRAIQFDHGQFSGNLFTSVANCMINCLYIRYCWYLKHDDYFDDNVRMVVCGDDNVISVVDSAISTFNGPIIAQLLSTIGQTYTSDSKDKPLTDYEPFDNITFGGCRPYRETLTSIYPGRYVGVLTPERIKNALSWSFDPTNQAWLRSLAEYAICGGYHDILQALTQVDKSFYAIHHRLLGHLWEDWDALRRRTYTATTRPIVKAESETIAELPPITQEVESPAVSDEDDDMGEQPPQQVIEQSFYRSTVSLATTNPVGTVLYSADIYELIGDPNNLQTQMMRSYQYFAPDIYVDIVFNGQPLTQGLVACLWLSNVPEDFVLDNDLIFNYPNVAFIRTHVDNHLRVKIPYKYFKEMLNTKKGAGNVTEAFGKFFITVVSPLNYQTGTNMNMTLSVSLGDTKFSIPRPIQELAPVDVVAEGLDFDSLSTTQSKDRALSRGRRHKSRSRTTVTKDTEIAIGLDPTKGRIMSTPDKIYQRPNRLSSRAKSRQAAPKNRKKYGVTHGSKKKKSLRPRIVKPKFPVRLSDLLENYDSNTQLYECLQPEALVEMIGHAVMSNAPIPVKTVGYLYRLIRKLVKADRSDPLKIISDLVSKFTYFDKPTVTTFQSMIERQPPQATTENDFPAAFMDFKPDGGVDPLRVDISTQETDIEYIMNREEIIGRYTWSTDQVANLTLGRFVLDSLVSTSVPAKVGPGRSILSAFKFYKADWIFKIRVIRNSYQRGALRFIAAFGEMDSTQTGYYRDSSYSEILMVDSQDEFTVRVPYTSVMQYLENPVSYNSRDLSVNTACGVCALEVMNPLVLSSATVASNVEVIVTVAFENVELIAPRPLPPYSLLSYSTDAFPIRAESLGPVDETEEIIPAPLGETQETILDMTPIRSLIELNRREILIPPDFLKVSGFTWKTNNTAGTQTTLAGYRILIELSPNMFFGSEHFRCFRGGLNLRIKCSNSRSSRLAYYPTTRSLSTVMTYGQVFNVPNGLSPPRASPLPLESVWFGDWISVTVPYRSLYTYLNRSLYDHMGYVELYVLGTGGTLSPDFTVWASFSDDTSMGTYVPRLCSLMNIGTVADYSATVN